MYFTTNDNVVNILDRLVPFNQFPLAEIPLAILCEHVVILSQQHECQRELQILSDTSTVVMARLEFIF